MVPTCLAPFRRMGLCLGLSFHFLRCANKSRFNFILLNYHIYGQNTRLILKKMDKKKG